MHIRNPRFHVKESRSAASESAVCCVGQSEWIGCRPRRRHTLMYWIWKSLLSRALCISPSLQQGDSPYCQSRLCVTSVVAASRLHSSLNLPGPNPQLPLPPFLFFFLFFLQTTPLPAFDRYTAQRAGWNRRQLESNCLFMPWGRTVNV